MARTPRLKGRGLQIQKGLLPAGNPIGKGTTGEVVEPIGADAPSTYVVWTDGKYAYEISGGIVPSITLAESLVRVQP